MKKLFAIGTVIIAVISMFVFGKTVLHTSTVIDDCMEDLEKSYKDYVIENISDFNEDEMDILEQYGSRMAMYTHGYRIVAESRGQDVVGEYVYIADESYMLVITTMNDGQLVYEFVA